MSKEINQDDRTRVLVISHEMVGVFMAGPGIRYLQLAQVLAREFAVTLAVPHAIPAIPSTDIFSLVEYQPRDWRTLERFARAARVIILPGILVVDFPELSSGDAAIVIDGYDPYMAEWLMMTQENPDAQRIDWSAFASTLTQQCLIGDFYICASERQRDWWLGQLEAYGRINPWTFGKDASFRRLVDVVPFGLDESLARHTRPVIKGVWNGIQKDDRVILWGGGLWPWLDPLTAIRAFAQVYEHRKDARLIFPGTEHPNPVMKAMPTHHHAARNLASQLGLLDRTVFFGDWVPYEDWQNVLLESDVALTLHGDETLESRLAFRSRVLDYIWAGLPIVATRGDATSDLIAENGLGMIVESRDVEGTARAILHLLDAPEEYQWRIEQSRAQWTWEHAAAPLVRFCQEPYRAPDKVTLGDQMGNPFYVAQLHQARDKNAGLQNLLSEYERRRSVQWANRMARFFKRSP